MRESPRSPRACARDDGEDRHFEHAGQRIEPTATPVGGSPSGRVGRVGFGTGGVGVGWGAARVRIHAGIDWHGGQDLAARVGEDRQDRVAVAHDIDVSWIAATYASVLGVPLRMSDDFESVVG